MNAVAAPESNITPDSPSTEPVYVRSESGTIFGWLHRAQRPRAAGIGVVICKPFGFEAVSSHLSLRAFAEAAADAGLPTLRLDYSGTGDSEDLDVEANQVQAWLADIEAGVAELRRLTGVESVCLLGFRLGALLAALGAARCPHVRAVIAVAPIVNGKRYVSELRNFERAAMQRLAALHPGSDAPGEAQPAGRSHLEVSGFPLARASIEELLGIELAQAEPGAARYLIIDRNDLPAARSWADKLLAAGCQVDYRAMPGFIEMMMRAPDLTVIPTDMIAAVREWLAQLCAQAPAGAAGAGLPAASSSELLLGPKDLPTSVIEHPVRLGAEPQLFGILTRPAASERRRRGVILLNSGGDYHIGPRRMHVSLARRWAGRGCYVLRLDLSGLGDSDKLPGEPGNVVFPPRAMDDIRLAVEHMRATYGVQELTLGGMCSGAFHSLRAAVAQLRVNRIILVNPLNFFWEKDMTLETVQTWEVAHKPAEYRRQLFSLRAWRRVLFGEVSLLRVLKVYFKGPLFALHSQLRSVARQLGVRLKNDLARELQQVAADGVGIVFVFSRDDAGINLLQMESGLSTEGLRKRYRLRLVDGADHNFTRSGPRAMLEQVLSEELFAGHVAEPARAEPACAERA